MPKKSKKRKVKQNKRVTAELLIIVGVLAVLLAIVLLIINRGV